MPQEDLKRKYGGRRRKHYPIHPFARWSIFFLVIGIAGWLTMNGFGYHVVLNIVPKLVELAPDAHGR